MYRNPELIRKILLKIEAFPYPNQYMTFKFEDFDALDVNYHMLILQDSGLLEAEENRYSCFDEWSNVRLTWDGHELAGLMHDEQRWQSACERMEQQRMWNFAVLRGWLKEAVKT
jgi:hypothetical protein